VVDALDACKILLYTRYDFGSGIDFIVIDFNKAVNNLGTIRLKVSAGNNAGTHSREKHFSRFNEDDKKVGLQKKTFLLVVSSKTGSGFHQFVLVRKLESYSRFSSRRAMVAIHECGLARCPPAYRVNIMLAFGQFVWMVFWLVNILN
jgi:hypothetical protein